MATTFLNIEIRCFELIAKHMLPIVVTSNEMISSIHKVEAVSMTLVDVQ